MAKPAQVPGMRAGQAPTVRAADGRYYMPSAALQALGKVLTSPSAAHPALGKQFEFFFAFKIFYSLLKFEKLNPGNI